MQAKPGVQGLQFVAANSGDMREDFDAQRRQLKGKGKMDYRQVHDENEDASSAPPIDNSTVPASSTRIPHPSTAPVPIASNAAGENCVDGGERSGGMAGPSSTPDDQAANPIKIRQSRTKTGAEKLDVSSPAFSSKTKELRRKFFAYVTADEEFLRLLQVFKDMVG